MIAFLFDDPKNMESMTDLCCKYNLDVNLAMDSKSLLSQSADLYLTDRADLCNQYSDMPNLIYVGDSTDLKHSEKRCIGSFDSLPSYLENTGIQLIQYDSSVDSEINLDDFAGIDIDLNFDDLGMDALSALADDIEIEYANEDSSFEDSGDTSKDFNGASQDLKVASQDLKVISSDYAVTSPESSTDSKPEPPSVESALQRSRQKSKSRTGGMMQALRDLASEKSELCVSDLKESVKNAEVLLKDAVASSGIATNNSLKMDPIPESGCEEIDTCLDILTDLNSVDFSKYKRDMLISHDYDEEISIPESELEHQEYLKSVQEFLNSEDAKSDESSTDIDLEKISQSISSWMGVSVDNSDELRDKRLAEVREVYAKSKVKDESESMIQIKSDVEAESETSVKLNMESIVEQSSNLEAKSASSVSEMEPASDLKLSSRDTTDFAVDLESKSESNAQIPSVATQDSTEVTKVPELPLVSSIPNYTDISRSLPHQSQQTHNSIDLSGKSEPLLTPDEERALEEQSRDLYAEMQNKPTEVVIGDRFTEDTGISQFGTDKSNVDTKSAKDDFTYVDVSYAHDLKPDLADIAADLLGDDMPSESGKHSSESAESIGFDELGDLSHLCDSGSVDVKSSSDEDTSDENTSDELNVTGLLQDLGPDKTDSCINPKTPELHSQHPQAVLMHSLDKQNAPAGAETLVPEPDDHIASTRSDDHEVSSKADISEASEILPISESIEDTDKVKQSPDVGDFITYADIGKQDINKSDEAESLPEGIELQNLQLEEENDADLLNLGMNSDDQQGSKHLHLSGSMDSVDISGKDFEYDSVEFEDGVEFEDSGSNSASVLKDSKDSKDSKNSKDSKDSKDVEVSTDTSQVTSPKIVVTKPEADTMKPEVDSVKPEVDSAKPKVDPVKPEVTFNKSQPKRPQGVQKPNSRKREQSRRVSKSNQPLILGSQGYNRSAQNVPGYWQSVQRGSSRASYGQPVGRQQVSQGVPNGYIVPPVKPSYNPAPLIPNPHGFAAESAQYFKQQQELRTFETFQGYAPQIKQVSARRPVSKPQSARVMHGSRVKMIRRVIVVGSVSHQSGCSSLAYNIACGYGSEPGNKVLLIDLDILNPGLSSKVYQTFKLNYHDTCGIDSILQTNADAYISNIDLFTKHIVNHRGEGFSLIRGNSVYNADIKKALTLANYIGLIDRLSEIFNVVVIDIGDCSNRLPYQQYLMSKYYTVMLYNCFNKKSIMESHQYLLDLATPFDFVLTRYSVSINPVELERNLHRRFIGKICESRTLQLLQGVCNYSDITDDSIAADWQMIQNNLLHS